MTDHPILFSAPMVLAILAGHKTQTRRVVTFQYAAEVDAWAQDVTRPEMWRMGVMGEGGPMADTGAIRCPYGQPGDRLWVRETHCLLDIPHSPWPDLPHRCGGDGLTCHYRVGFDRTEPRWRPSIHMPRWASRIILEVLDVRVERLQDISEADARAEGVVVDMVDSGGQDQTGNWIDIPDYIGPFMRLWDSINGKRPGCSWAANPWVWRVEFRVTG